MRLQTKIWPAVIPDQYALLQNNAGGSSLKLVGTNLGSFPSISYGTRTVGISSTDDLSGIQFTVNGFYNNNVATETITGPGAGLTVYTNQAYDSIVAIIPSGAATNVIAGPGLTGFMTPFLVNAHTTTFGVTVSTTVLAGDISYTVYQSQFRPNIVGEIAAANSAHFADNAFPGFTLPSHIDQLISTHDPFQMIAVEVITTDGVTPTNATGSLQVTVLQNGIT
jgi:hypothetical protein